MIMFIKEGAREQQQDIIEVEKSPITRNSHNSRRYGKMIRWGRIMSRSKWL